MEKPNKNRRPAAEAHDRAAEPYHCAAATPNLKGDWSNFFLLLLLYTMQGLPYGISTALPIIFQSKNVVSYQDQVIVTANHVAANVREDVKPSPRKTT